MKSLFITAGFIVQFTISATAQIESHEVGTYTPAISNPGIQIATIPVRFNDSHLNSSDLGILKDKTVIRIDLVYTMYKENAGFDQDRLNHTRMKSLQKSFKVASDPLVEWHSFGQTDGSTRDQAASMFHGFVVYYRETPSPESMEKEIRFIEALMEGSGTIDSEYGRLFGTRGLPDEKTFEETVIEVEGPSFKTSTDAAGVEVRLYSRYPEPGEYGFTSGNTTYTEYESEYSIFKKVMERHPQWQNSLVLMDVTGSMSPYIGTTMKWIKATQDSSQVDAFVFFNDGDNKSDYLKRTGSVGGIYGTRNTSLKQVMDNLTLTMGKGGGGDSPENNIEATIYGLEEYGDCDEIIMIADNYATPRDLSLISQVKVPIHIILCGAQGGVNLAYLNAAYATGGSVHLIEEDLEIRNIKPGVTFQLGKSYFTLQNGRIIRAEQKG